MGVIFCVIWGGLERGDCRDSMGKPNGDKRGSAMSNIACTSNKQIFRL